MVQGVHQASRISAPVQNGGDRTLSAPVQSCGGLRSAFLHGSHGTNVALSPGHSPVFIPAPPEKGFTGFMMDFLKGGVSATVLKIADALLQRIKLLIQIQDEMLKSGRLFEPYQGITDCFGRIIKEERVISLWRGNTMISLWRGNTANVICYFHTLQR